MGLLRSQMRNQLINYAASAASLRHFRDGKVNQGRQSLTLHLASDVADRLEPSFEPIPPATLSVCLSRHAVGREDQSPVSADPFFVSQLIRVEAQRPFGVLIARLHRGSAIVAAQADSSIPIAASYTHKIAAHHSDPPLCARRPIGHVPIDRPVVSKPPPNTSPWSRAGDSESGQARMLYLATARANP